MTRNEIYQIIVDDVYKTLDKYYLKYKEKQGLYSLQNILVYSLKNHIKEWEREKEESHKRLNKLCKKRLK